MLGKDGVYETSFIPISVDEREKIGFAPCWHSTTSIKPICFLKELD